MITLGLADDQALFLHGIRNVLDSQPDMEVRWLAANGEEAVQACGSDPVGIVLMDVQMPVLDGIAATRRITQHHPDTKVIVLTTFDDEDYVLGGIGAGASGFLLKDAEPEALLDAIRTVAGGDAVISPRATNRIVAKLAAPTEEAVALSPADRLGLGELTEREREVLIAIARGWSNGEISERMFISMPTVKTHVGRVLAKTQSRDRVHAALFAYRTGLVSRADLLDS
ncbi:Transcriptional regulatory protein DegU [Corynebacterium afermentans subsp. afermentans]|uniref:Two component transcriptional regulator, LuxR family n=1 Tax=Corynebacterium afermentans TaxID=38286 RepID=A0A9X8WHE7_9CORY|nr:response regulator transcription factor [Corynebacterium afermentans]OAA17039.1 DNA-binding response regulator [Corynebacterium afermentans subsp. afermentans]WJY56571.1 Transcriptional regulatory protein DegU [Corynebacterium afermentans subsp. afermentans]SIQ14899.1 two component transcriptional regulator, LuxR family [Corynebacterium afermentans]